MTALRLSPAMRTMLRNLTNGQPSTRGLAGGPYKHAATQAALKARGLLDQEAKPTAAGRAVFGKEANPC